MADRRKKWIIASLLAVLVGGCAWLDAFRRTEEFRADQDLNPIGRSAGDNSPVFITAFNIAQMSGVAGVACLFMLWLFVRERYKASALYRVMSATETMRGRGSAEDVVTIVRQNEDQTERVIQSMANKFARRKRDVFNSP